jgi:hypothetical protein
MDIIMKSKNKNINLGDGTALFVNEFGATSVRVFRVIKVEGKFSTIEFPEKDQYTIPTKNIRVKRTILWKTTNGKVISQSPDSWGEIDLPAQGIKTLRFNLQNFSLEEKKAAIHRWTLPTKMPDKLISLLKMLFICVAVGAIGWAAFKAIIYIFPIVMNSRILDCAQLIPKFPVPIGAANFTMPVGV